MQTFLVVLLAVLAAEHAYFLYLEMFSWTSPRTRKAFGTTTEFAEETKTLAANQGLYNGFLAAGCVWAIISQGELQEQLAIFFSSCVLVAGIYGGLTVNLRIALIQGLPAAACLAVALFA